MSNFTQYTDGLNLPGAHMPWLWSTNESKGAKTSVVRALAEHRLVGMSPVIPETPFHAGGSHLADATDDGRTTARGQAAYARYSVQGYPDHAGQGKGRSSYGAHAHQ